MAVTRNDKPEAVRAVEELALKWLGYLLVFGVTPALLFAQITEWRAGRYDAGLAVLLVSQLVSVTLFLLVRTARIRAWVLSAYLLVAASIAVLRYGPNMSISIAFLGAAMIVLTYVGKRAASVCFGIIVLLLVLAAIAHTHTRAVFYAASSADLTMPLNWLRMSLTALSAIGVILLLFGILHDGLLCAAHEAQTALERERHERDERRTAELALAESQRQEIVSRVAAGAAHDLNNVLTAVMGAAELAALEAEKRGIANPELKIISEAAERASALTRQLLSFAKSQITRRKYSRLCEIVTGLKGLVQRLIPSNIEISIDARDRSIIFADSGQIEQIVLNLCVNARDAMPEGGRLVLRVFATSLSDGTPGVAVSVTDTGTGIPEEIRDRIFEPFFTTKTDGRGTGLGLPTVRIIAQAHRGEISCESAIGTGTTMTVRFPLAEVGEEEPQEAFSSGGSREPFRGGEAILVCDDDELVRETARRILEPAGYTVRTVGDGASALSAAEEREYRLVVVDAVMPGTSGRQLYEALRNAHPEMRFLFSTGYDPGIFGQEFFDDPRHYLLAKPYGRNDMLKAVRAAIDGPASGEPTSSAPT